MSTIADNATDALHSLGSRLTLPDDIADGIADELASGIDTLSGAILPSTTVVVGAGTRAAVAGGRTVRRHPLLIAGGALALIAAVAWLVSRRRSADSNSPSDAVDRTGRRDAA